MITCYRNCNNTNKIFTEILEPTNLLKDIEKTETTQTQQAVKTSKDDDIVKKLKDLKALYESGALTKEEFEKAKNKLLN